MDAYTIVQITAAVSVLVGLALLAMLAGAVRRAHNAAKVKRFQSEDAGLCDLLNYAAVVDDGVIVGKNGSLMAAWRYKGDDDASSTVEQRELVAQQINAALARKGNGWMVHIDAVRELAPSYSDSGLSHFPDPVSRAIDAERRRFFAEVGTLYQGHFVLSLTWFPSTLAERRFVELMFDDDETPPDHKSRTAQLIEVFKRECDNLEDRLSAVLSLKRLKSRKEEAEDGRVVTYDDFLAWLHYCVTGVKQPIVLPDTPMYIDALVGGQEMWTGTVPKIGRKFIQTVSIEGFPGESFPGILSDLADLPCEYRWSSRFIFMDQHEALSHLDDYRKKWRQKIRGIFDQIFNTGSGKVDQDALSMVADADAAIAETNSRLIAQGYFTSLVVLMSEDRAQVSEAARRIEKEINARGFAARVETINTVDAFLGSLPGHGVENIRRPLIHTGNLADMMPTSSIWSGEEGAPCPMYPPLSPPLMHAVTAGNTPFRLNLHVRDLGHGIMLGPTRAGKSTHLAAIAAQFRRYRGSRVVAFDKGLSLYPICKAVGGQHYHIGAGSAGSLAFCPLQFLKTKADRAWAMEWIDTILALNNIQTTPAQRNEIGTAIENMAATGQKTMTEFRMSIQDDRIREALSQYTAGGLMGDLLDAEKDGLALMDFVVFEIEDLMNLGEKYALPVLLYLFRRIEMSLDGRPTLIPLDEAWIMLGHKVFAGKIREWLKSVAKKNCAILMATQNLSDAANSGIIDVIVESTATKIFLPNIYARDQETAALYARMGLNKRQIDLIASATPKRDYYYVSERGRRMYQLALGPVTLAFVGATDLDSIAEIRELEAKHGPHWPAAWLKKKGVPDVAFSR